VLRRNRLRIDVFEGVSGHLFRPSRVGKVAILADWLVKAIGCFDVGENIAANTRIKDTYLVAGVNEIDE
jgi:hypothetical protein